MLLSYVISTVTSPLLLVQLVTPSDASTGGDVPERVFKVYEDENAYNSETSHELTEKLIKSGVELFDRKSDKEKVTSIGVLYIKNLGSEEDDFFCYGITEDLIHDLSRAKRMRIPKITEVIKFKESTDDDFLIGESLNVDYVINGNIMKMNDKFKISIHLSNIKSSSEIWDNSWEGTVKNIQSIRSEISIKVLDSINVSIPEILLENIKKIKYLQKHMNYLQKQNILILKQRAELIEKFLKIYIAKQ